MRLLYWYLGAGALAGGLAWWFFGDSEPGGVVGDVRQLFLDAINGITQGARLTRCPYDKTTGVVPCDPGELAGQAGATLEEYALARNIASEEGNSPPAVQALVAQVAKNEAARRGISIAALLLNAVNSDHSGNFGTQKDIDPSSDRKGSSDRWASTASDPYAGHLAVARGVLSGSIPDISGGANQYDRPSGESNPDAIAKRRVAAGSELVDLGDVGQGDLRFWRLVN